LDVRNSWICRDASRWSQADTDLRCADSEALAERRARCYRLALARFPASDGARLARKWVRSQCGDLRSGNRKLESRFANRVREASERVPICHKSPHWLRTHFLAAWPPSLGRNRAEREAITTRAPASAALLKSAHRKFRIRCDQPRRVPTDHELRTSKCSPYSPFMHN